MGILIWIASIVATLIIADQKKMNVVGFFLLSVFTGPLALVIVLVVSPKGGTVNVPQDVTQQLNELKNSMIALRFKVDRLETLIGKPSGQQAVDEVPMPIFEGPPAKIEKGDVIQGRMAPGGIPEKEIAVEVQRPSDMELDFGRNWLNKIGIVVFTLGVVFLISYTFKYFGPFFKIAFGYLISAAFFILGFKLEAKEKFLNFGRALLGGGWALVYFTTYAMHHFEASRLIENQVVDLGLLTLVVAGMMVHVVKYKSEGMMSVTLFVAYVTSTFGHITSFTILSNLLLAVLVLFLVYKFQWVKTFILAITLTYGIHFVWVAPNLMTSPPQAALFGIATPSYHLFMDFVFLTSYGLVFFAGIHIAKAAKNSQLMNTLAAINFGNIALYNALAYSLILKLFYTQRFALIFGEGVLYLAAALASKKMGRERLYISDIVAGVFAVTLSFSMKFLPTSALLMWLIEVPFLLFIGVNFKERIFRYLSYALAIFIAWRLFFLYVLNRMPDVEFLGLLWRWPEFMSLWAGISMAACFYLIQGAKVEKKFVDIFDEIFDQIFPAVSCAYVTFLVVSMIKQPWLTFVLSMEGMVLFAVSVLLTSMRFRIYVYLVLALAGGIFMLENIYAPSDFLKWLIISTDVLVFFGTYFIMRFLNQTKQVKLIFDGEEVITFWGGMAMVVFTVFQYIHPQWISLTLGIVGMVLILTGILNKNKTERLGGLMLFALTLARVALVDLAGLDIIFKIVTFIALGVLFLGVSFIYNRFNIEQGKK